MARDLRTNRTALLQIGALCSVIAFSAALIQFAWAAAFQPIHTTASARKMAPGITVAALQLVSETPFEPDALLSRPLFSPTRARPNPPPAPSEPEQSVSVEPPPAPELEPPTYLVSGIVVGPAVHRTLLRTQTHEKGRWFEKGETTAEGWRIASVERQAVVLERSGRLFVLKLPGRANID